MIQLEEDRLREEREKELDATEGDEWMNVPEHSWIMWRGGFNGQGVRFHASTGDTRHKTAGKTRNGETIIQFNTFPRRVRIVMPLTEKGVYPRARPRPCTVIGKPQPSEPPRAQDRQWASSSSQREHGAGPDAAASARRKHHGSGRGGEGRPPVVDILDALRQSHREILSVASADALDEHGRSIDDALEKIRRLRGRLQSR